MQLAMEQSYLDPHHMDKEQSANRMLEQLNPIQMPNGIQLHICQDNIIGDGFCFFIA